MAIEGLGQKINTSSVEKPPEQEVEKKKTIERNMADFLDCGSSTKRSFLHMKGNGDQCFSQMGPNTNISAVMDTADSEKTGIMSTKRDMVKFLSHRFKDLVKTLSRESFNDDLVKLGLDSQTGFKDKPAMFAATIAGVFKEEKDGKTTFSAEVAQLGDTAAYVFRKNEKTFRRVTEVLGTRKSTERGWSTRLTNHLGWNSDPGKARPKMYTVKDLSRGDMIVLFSDGVHNNMNFKSHEEEIKLFLSTSYSKSAKEIAKKLVTFGINEDDRTALVTRIKEPEADLQNPKVEKKITARIMESLKNTDWKEILLSAGAGTCVRIGAKVALDAVSFWAKTGVAAAAGGVTAGVKDWWKQRKELNEKANKTVRDFIDKPENSEISNDPLIAELRGKIDRHEKLSVKDLKNYLKPKSERTLSINAESGDTKRQIFEQLEKMKIDKIRSGVSVLKGAAFGAIGATVVGEIVEYTMAHHLGDASWSYVSEHYKEFLGWMGKGLSKVMPAHQAVEHASTVVKNLPKIPTVNFIDLIKQKDYKIPFEKIQSLTIGARRLIGDYLLNEEMTGASEPLTIAQRVNAETYLSQVMEQMKMHPGTSFEMKGSLIAEAVDKARHLSAGELSNLAKNLKTPEHSLSSKTVDSMMSKTFSYVGNKIDVFKYTLSGRDIILPLTVNAN